MSRPFRYTFILLLVGLGTCLAAVFGWRFARASAPVSGPIVLVSVDALRADHLAAYNARASARTPAIDALAKDGVVFERAYAHTPETLSSHTALLSGRLPFETGVRGPVGFKVPDGERLLAEMLADRGFATGGIVSTFLLRKATGIGQGFTFFDDALLIDETTTPGIDRSGDESARVAEDWLTSIGTPRAFLFLQLNDLHRPYARRHDDGADLSYDRRLERVDAAVGGLVRYLKTHQLYDQATVILVADHGEGLGDHGETAHGGLVNDEVLRVPFIVKAAAGEGAGSRVRTLVQLVDLVPTVLDLAKAPIPGNLQGRSLTAFIGGHEEPAGRTAYAESLFPLYHFGWSVLTSLTDGRYQYIASSTREELYDLDHDSPERQDLAQARPDLMASFRDKLRRLAPPAPTPPDLASIDAEALSKYRVLGYVGDVSAYDPALAEHPDPRDHWDIVEQYRAAVELAALRQWNASIDRFMALTKQQPQMRDVWLLLGETAARGERHDVAAEAYLRAVALDAHDADAHLDAAGSLLALRRHDEAARQARHVVADVEAGARATAAAHAMLARIALGRRDVATARAEADRAQEADATLPVRAYVDARIAFERRQYDAALAGFEEASAKANDAPANALDLDARLYAAEALLRLERYSEAEYLFLEELKRPRLNRRARMGLQSLYTATGRTAEATALTSH